LRNCANAFSVISETWCSIPSASACRLGRHAERAEQVDDEPVADAHAVGQRLSLLGEEDPAIRARGGQAGAFEARDRLHRGGVGDAKPAGDVGRPRFACPEEQIGDQLDIVFQQGGRLRRARLAETARLGAFLGKLFRGVRALVSCIRHRQSHVLQRSQPGCGRRAEIILFRPRQNSRCYIL
jgi:hypothetical protein